MPVLIVTGVVLAALVYYVAECAWWPFAACLRCGGAGRRSRKDGRVWRTCRRCKGDGKRLRIGRRVWNRIRSIEGDAR